jgi:hypothetical protein
MATLDELRRRLAAAVERNAWPTLEQVFRDAATHGWAKLLRSMSDHERDRLLTLLTHALRQQQELVKETAAAYDRVLVDVAQAADDEIQRLSSELERADRHLDHLAAFHARPRTNWLALGVAGLLGYWIGKRRRHCY